MGVGSWSPKCVCHTETEYINRVHLSGRYLHALAGISTHSCASAVYLRRVGSSFEVERPSAGLGRIGIEPVAQLDRFAGSSPAGLARPASGPRYSGEVRMSDYKCQVPGCGPSAERIAAKFPSVLHSCCRFEYSSLLV